MNKEFIYLDEIKEEHLPVIVLAADSRSFVGWGIKAITKGNYNHAMRITKLGYFDSQNPGGYKRILYSKYANAQTKLKFMYFPDAPQEQKDEFIRLTNERLEKIERKTLKTFFFGKYDYLAILGQALRIKWLQNPFKEFCSELEVQTLNKAFGFNLQERLDPAALNRELKKQPLARCIGYWFID